MTTDNDNDKQNCNFKFDGQTLTTDNDNENQNGNFKFDSQMYLILLNLPPFYYQSCIVMLSHESQFNSILADTVSENLKILLKIIKNNPSFYKTF